MTGFKTIKTTYHLDKLTKTDWDELFDNGFKYMGDNEFNESVFEKKEEVKITENAR